MLSWSAALTQGDRGLSFTWAHCHCSDYPVSSARRSKICCHHFNKGLSSKVMDVCYLHHDDLSLLVITLMHRKQGHAQYMHIIMSCIQYAVRHSNTITSLFLFGHKTVGYLQIKQELNSFFLSIWNTKGIQISIGVTATVRKQNHSGLSLTLLSETINI